MSLDWTIVVAQVANFLILVWLLRRFLYIPVRNAMTAREERLAAERRQARDQIAAARAEAAAYRDKIAVLEANKEAILAEAIKRAEQERARRLESAAEEVEAARTALYQRLEEERMALEARIKEDLVREACAAAGRVIADLTDAALTDALIGVFGRQIGESTAQDSGDRGQGLGESVPVEIRTSFQPTPAQRERLRAIVAQWRGGDGEVAFHYDPSLILGIELTGPGETVGWSAKDRLASIEVSALAAMGGSTFGAGLKKSAGGGIGD